VSRRERAGAILAFVVLLGSCAMPSSNDMVLLSPGQGDARIQAACDVTARACTRCHELSRVYVARFARPADWQSLVYRMRFMPSNSITDAEAVQATDCLVFRAFGQAGVDQLVHEGPPGPQGVTK